MAITASDVQKLREQTGAGMMDCKKALEESNGDNEKANEILRKKGLAAAAKRAGKSAAEGLVHCYIHSNSKIGVLIEVNCETDFAARSDAFKDLCKELSMQVAAANPRWVRREEIPAAIIEKEREIYRDQAKATGKPEKVIEKIAEGKLEKFFQDFCLVDQVYIKDDKRKVKDLINDAVGKIRENLVVRRYARFQVGEQLAAEPAPQE